MKRTYYFDNAATSFPKPESVYNAIESFMRTSCANPGRAAHKMSLESARIIFQCRELFKELFNAYSSENIIFTSNATEALNLVILSFLHRGDTVVTTSMEHNSVMRPLTFLALTKSINIVKLKHNKKGEICYNDLIEKLSLKPKLLIVNHASNVNGIINNMEMFSNLKEKFNFKLLIDASQSAGVKEIDVQLYNIDFLCFTGHKSLLGPQGTGGLYIKEANLISPLKFGGTGSLSEEEIQPDFLPDKFESGTHNCIGLAGLKEGLKFINKKSIHNIFKHKTNLVEYFVSKLEHFKYLNVFYGNSIENNCGVVSVNSEKISPSTLAMYLDKRYNIAVRAGLHCAPSAHKVIGTFPEGTVRFSFSVFNNKEEIDYVVESIKEIFSHIS